MEILVIRLAEYITPGKKLIYGMEFLPRLFDSFSHERIPSEKQKNKRHHLQLVSLVCVFRRCWY